MTAAETLVFSLERGVAARRAALGTTRLERCNTNEHDASANHVQIFGNTARYVDHAPSVFGVHAVINNHDSATIIIKTTHGDLATQRKVITGTGKLTDIETLTGRGPPPLKAMAIETGLPVQTGPVAVDDVGEADFGGKPGCGTLPGSAGRLASLPGFRCLAGRCGLGGFRRRLAAGRASFRRGKGQAQGTEQRRKPDPQIRPPRSVLRHPDGPG